MRSWGGLIWFITFQRTTWTKTGVQRNGPPPGVQGVGSSGTPPWIAKHALPGSRGRAEGRGPRGGRGQSARGRRGPWLPTLGKAAEHFWSSLAPKRPFQNKFRRFSSPSSFLFLPAPSHLLKQDFGHQETQLLTQLAYRRSTTSTTWWTGRTAGLCSLFVLNSSPGTLHTSVASRLRETSPRGGVGSSSGSSPPGFCFTISVRAVLPFLGVRPSRRWTRPPEVEGVPRRRILLGGFGMGGALVLKTVR